MKTSHSDTLGKNPSLLSRSEMAERKHGMIRKITKRLQISIAAENWIAQDMTTDVFMLTYKAHNLPDCG